MEEYFITEIIDKTEDNYQIGEPFIFENLQFETGKSTLLPLSFPELNQLRAFLIKHPQTKLKIVGHTDNTGNSTSNLKLSFDRAKAVMQFLAQDNRINLNNISTQGKGDTEPICSNSTETGRETNRRVEFLVF